MSEKELDSGNFNEEINNTDFERKPTLVFITSPFLKNIRVGILIISYFNANSWFSSIFTLYTSSFSLYSSAISETIY